MKSVKGFRSVNVLGYQVFSSTLNILNVIDSNEKTLINTFSPNSYGLALKDKYFEKSLKNSDILVLDGVGIAFGSILLNGKNIKKIAGQDCFDHFMAVANQHHLKVFFLGSTEATLEKMKKRASMEFPNVAIGTYSPPFRETFTEDDDKKIHAIINEFSPDILFVGLTAPKQEKWAYANKDKLNVKIISTIGNVFDWYAGNSKRPAKIWIDLRLEWLVRIFLRPEIFRRNTKNQLKFVRDVFLHLFCIKRTPQNIEKPMENYRESYLRGQFKHNELVK